MREDIVRRCGLVAVVVLLVIPGCSSSSVVHGDDESADPVFPAVGSIVDGNDFDQFIFHDGRMLGEDYDIDAVRGAFSRLIAVSFDCIGECAEGLDDEVMVCASTTHLASSQRSDVDENGPLRTLFVASPAGCEAAADIRAASTWIDDERNELRELRSETRIRQSRTCRCRPWHASDAPVVGEYEVTIVTKLGSEAGVDELGLVTSDYPDYVAAPMTRARLDGNRARLEFLMPTSMAGDSLALAVIDSDVPADGRIYRLDTSSVDEYIGLLIAARTPYAAVASAGGETHYRDGLARRDLPMTVESAW